MYPFNDIPRLFSDLCAFLPILSQCSATYNDDFPFSTVIDILSSNEEYSTFLRILQRTGNIPYLNELGNFTLLAPTNSAFGAQPIDYSEFDIENYILHDSVITTEEMANKTILLTNNVKFPFILGQTPYSDTDTDTSFTVNGVPIVGYDLVPNLQNAVVQGISNIIDVPLSLDEVIQAYEEETRYKDAYTFNSVRSVMKHLPQSVDHLIRNNNTVLVPCDDNFVDNFNHIEISYLLDSYNNSYRMQEQIRAPWISDMVTLCKNFVIDGPVGGSLQHRTIVENMNGEPIEIESDTFGTTYTINSKFSSVATNREFNFGVAHFVPYFDFIKDKIQFNAEKYLHGLNCSGFVKEMYFRDLQKFIQDVNRNITIFIPTPDQNDEVGYSKSTLLYHFVQRQVWLENEFPALTEGESSTQIFNSSFCSSNKKLGGNCQRMKITKSGRGYLINNKYKISQSKPYRIGNALIYQIDGELSLPGDLINSISPFDHCSLSVTFLRQLNLLDLEPNNHGYTIFLPCFNAWDKWGLNTELVQQNQALKERIMKNYILDGLYYSNVENNETVFTRNLLGEPVRLSISVPNENGTYDSNQLPVTVAMNSTDGLFKTRKNSDILFNLGVVHPLKDVVLPRDIKITMSDLIEVTQTTEIFDFLKKFPALEEAILGKNQSYSILVPTSASLQWEGINVNYTNLEKLLNLHILRRNETERLLQCSGETYIKTVSGQLLECREESASQSYFLKLKDGGNNEVRVLKRGCTTESDEYGNRACVFVIDRPISLSWLAGDHYHLTLPIAAVGVGVILGVSFIISVLFCVVTLQIPHRSKNTPINDEETAEGGTVTGDRSGTDIENDPRRPLLAGRSEGRNANSRGGEMQHDRLDVGFGSMARGYSSNSVSQPIDVSRR